MSEEALIKLYRKEIDELKHKLSESESRRVSTSIQEAKSIPKSHPDYLKIIANYFNDDKLADSHNIPSELAVLPFLCRL